MLNSFRLGTAIAEERCTFWCVHCGHHAVCHVVGEGHAFVPGRELFDDVAERRAHRAAEPRARSRAQALAALAACPRCGLRDARAWSKEARWTWLFWLGPSAFFVILALVCAALAPWGLDAAIPAMILMAIGGAVARWFAFSRRRDEAREVDGRVTFEARDLDLWMGEDLGSESTAIP